MKSLPFLVLSLAAAGALSASAQAEALDLDALLDDARPPAPPSEMKSCPARGGQRGTGLQQSGLRTSSLGTSGGLRTGALSERLSADDWKQLFARRPKTSSQQLILAPR